jgi:hypothetical protein
MIDAGDADCTTGLSGEIYSAWVADSRNGFALPLDDNDLGDTRPMLRANVWAFAQKIALAVNAGGMSWRGTYSGATAYAVNDVVRSGSATYVAIAATTGHTPPNATYWEVVAEAPDGGITESQHEALDTIVHDLAEDAYTEVERTSGQVARVTVWTSSAMTLKIRETLITYASGLVVDVAETQFDSGGSPVATLTDTVTRSSGLISHVDTVRT